MSIVWETNFGKWALLTSSGNVQNSSTHQISYAYPNSVNTKYYDRISFSLILHHTNHIKKQGRLPLATVDTDYMWKLYVKCL
jgi:hypothetical protein